jgi:hypothetical protein
MASKKAAKRKTTAKTKTKTTAKRAAKDAPVARRVTMRALLVRLGIATSGVPSERARAYLARREVPAATVRELFACTFEGTIEIGPVRLFSVDDMPRANTEETFRRAVKKGFFVVGEGPTGDAVAVELATGIVAFLSHDVLLGFDPDCHRLDDAVARSPFDVVAFYDAASRDPTFPPDFYAAGGG